MAAQIPIGTRGTIGSLVRKEIDYFKNINTCPQFDPRRGNYEEKTKSFQQRDRSSRLSSWFSKTNWRKKKRQSRGGGGRFLPSMCSAVEVSGDSRVPGFTYRILKSEEKGLRV
ncbi:hypothetical protein EUTSA_v10027254mg [Eutrema salsugineum]|uniref:Uncharacterized protein n=1 Tax=Eutrema salsugineum TaxID=72664 RepID=V4P6K4_EUTSA|nr:uncharacterized protein LOC18028956 [Eutrema salsugineum]ESQ55186.1 hypothetical protein EUTSA_v10027254mg [Eutrema salsugineum]